jgi:hypothetical protein
MDEIPRELAFKLCCDIREENLGQRFSLARMQCWGCTRYAKGDPDRMCFTSQEGNRGCKLISKRYEQLRQQPPQS